MQLTRLGHSALLVETPYVRILLDPGGHTDDWHGLADLDSVLVTHQHADHFDPDNVEALMTVNPTARVIAEEAVATDLNERGIQTETASPGDTFDIGPMKVEAVGGIHALIHEQIPRIGNLGFVFAEADGARVFHPGDAYEYAPRGVDVLALPITAPWANVGATSDFLNAVAPPEAFPIHDAIVNEAGNAMYMRMVGELAAEGTTLHPVGPTESLNT